MDDTQPAEVLAELATLRRRVKADRYGYWFPLLVFGVLIAAATPLYIAPELPTTPGGQLAYSSQPDSERAGLYWLAALVAGGLLTVWWYRRRGRRIGLPRAGMLAVLTAVLAVAVAAVVQYAAMAFPPLSWLTLVVGRGYEATLVIAAGLIALAWFERSVALAGISAVYAAAALLASLYNVENVLFDLGWDPVSAHPDQLRLVALPNLLLPALVLLLAGSVTGLTALVRRRRVPV
jgi:hypothetical protein